jgi:hypothetical protein
MHTEGNTGGTSNSVGTCKLPEDGIDDAKTLLVFSPRAGLAGTRAQSGDRYGSGMLLSRQVLRGSLPLVSPAFRHSHSHHQMPPRPQRERS